MALGWVLTEEFVAKKIGDFLRTPELTFELTLDLKSKLVIVVTKDRDFVYREIMERASSKNKRLAELKAWACRDLQEKNLLKIIEEEPWRLKRDYPIYGGGAFDPECGISVGVTGCGYEEKDQEIANRILAAIGEYKIEARKIVARLRISGAVTIK